MSNSIICRICNKECNGYKGLGSHISKLHNISAKEYYDTYISSSKNHVCTVCNTPVRFVGLSIGYATHCSNKCAQLDEKTLAKQRQTRFERYGDAKYTNRQKAQETMLNLYGVTNISQTKDFGNKVKTTKKSKYGDENYNNREKAKQTCIKRYNVENTYQINEIKEKAVANAHNAESNIKRTTSKSNSLTEFELEHNCTRFGKIVQKYGQGWITIKNSLNLISYKGSTFIPNNQISIIEQYYNSQVHGSSKLEQSLLEVMDNITIIHRTKSVISPYELDYYLPDLHIAIEVNGSYWHSVEAGGSNDYHLMKSLLCREKNIRLIHIYEFEDIEEQKQLLKDLINGQDNYPKNDFNKNNLLENIPEPTVIYKDRYTIYGAGPLIKE